MEEPCHGFLVSVGCFGDAVQVVAGVFSDGGVGVEGGDGLYLCGFHDVVATAGQEQHRRVLCDGSGRVWGPGRTQHVNRRRGERVGDGGTSCEAADETGTG